MDKANAEPIPKPHAWIQNSPKHKFWEHKGPIEVMLLSGEHRIWDKPKYAFGFRIVVAKWRPLS